MYMYMYTYKFVQSWAAWPKKKIKSRLNSEILFYSAFFKLSQSSLPLQEISLFHSQPLELLKYPSFHFQRPHFLSFFPPTIIPQVFCFIFRLQKDPWVHTQLQKKHASFSHEVPGPNCPATCLRDGARQRSASITISPFYFFPKFFFPYSINKTSSLPTKNLFLALICFFVGKTDFKTETHLEGMSMSANCPKKKSLSAYLFYLGFTMPSLRKGGPSGGRQLVPPPRTQALRHRAPMTEDLTPPSLGWRSAWGPCLWRTWYLWVWEHPVFDFPLWGERRVRGEGSQRQGAPRLGGVRSSKGKGEVIFAQRASKPGARHSLYRRRQHVSDGHLCHRLKIRGSVAGHKRSMSHG